jgi:hypothetical protein
MAGLLFLGMFPPLTGCMHTRYAESSNFWNVGGGGGCTCGSEHHSHQKERHWSGFWFGQPDQVRP